MNLNQVTIIGRMVRDPEKKALPSGVSVVNVSVATSRTWKDKDGKKQEDAEFHNCVAFAKIADVMAQYLKKGQLVCITGRLQTRTWETEGKKNYRTEIVVEQMQMGPKAGNATGTSAKPAEASSDGIDYPVEAINPDDIPF